MKPDTQSYYAELVQRAIDRIATHLDEALDLHSLAAAANLSPFHFHRVFRGMTGETPAELARRLRLERAAWQLRSTTEPVTRIAFDAGFDTHESFTRAFRSQFDTSPSGFRSRTYQRTELPTMCGVHYTGSGRISAFVARLPGAPIMDVTITSMPELRLGTVRHIGPYNQIPVAFATLGARLGPAAGELMRAGSRMLAIYHDDPESVPLDQLRSDAAVSIPDGMAIPAGLVEQRLPAGRYACATHVGPYEQLGDAWLRLLGEWLPQSGERMANSECYELYVNDPSTTPKAELKTELYVPLVTTD